MVRKYVLDARALARREGTYLGSKPSPARAFEEHAPTTSEPVMLQHFSARSRVSVDPKFVGSGELRMKRSGTSEATTFGLPISFYYRAHAQPESIIATRFPVRHFVGAELSLFPINRTSGTQRDILSHNPTLRGVGIDAAAAGYQGIDFRRQPPKTGVHNEVVVLFDEQVPFVLPRTQSGIYDPRWHTGGA